jgi:hypothetical protein
MKIVSHKNWGGDTATLLKLYRTLIRSKLDYGCIVYGSARKSYLQMLDPIQTQALRLCMGAFRTSPVDSLQVEANEPPLMFCREKLTLQYCIKIKANPANPAYQCAFEPQYVQLFADKPNIIPPLSTRLATALSNIKLDISKIARIKVPTQAPWTLLLPQVIISLPADKKSLSNPKLLKAKFDSFLLENSDSYHIYTDGSKDQSSVAAAAIAVGRQFFCRLPDEATIFSAEARAILLALEIIRTTNNTKFFILSDSLSCLQAIHNHHYDHPTILEILEKCHVLITSEKGNYPLLDPKPRWHNWI